MENVSVNLRDNNYTICIGQGILNEVGNILSKEKKDGKCAIITNPTINKLYGNQIKKSLNSIVLQSVVLEVPDSETSKSLKEAEKLYVKLLDSHFDRNSMIIALGGGVVGDLAGFVAATYMRGVSFIQVPTTLLAQVDSAIGGKVAVDLLQGKNLIGAFYQPKLVLTDIDTLKTLPETELKSGLAEVIKYGIISDPDLFKLLEKNVEEIKQKNPNLLTEIVVKCSKIKAKVVERDEKEHGKRTILNLGHTLGHALETLTKYNRYGHGEAVAIGIVFASRISTKLGTLSNVEFRKILSLIQSMGLPTKIEGDFKADKIVETMYLDKKVRDEKIRMILPKRIGEVAITDEIPMNLLKKELEKMLP